MIVTVTAQNEYRIAIDVVFWKHFSYQQMQLEIRFIRDKLNLTKPKYYMYLMP